MPFPTRNSVKILLLNEANELLLMCADDPKITNTEGKYHGKFWFPIGGEIEAGESIEEAALRETYEETGLGRDVIELGPVVWFGEFELNLAEVRTLLKQKFIVARTKQTKISLDNLTQSEQAVIQKIEWFSLERIKNSPDIIYPIILPDYLPDVISKRYPPEPIEVDLAKQPA